MRETRANGGRNRRRTVALAAALALAAGFGCGYSFSGRGQVGDVYIPFFEDRTVGDRAVDLGTRMTELVANEFRQDRSTQVFQAAAERADADKELIGSVRRLTESILSRDPTEGGEEYRVVVQCAIVYRDLENDTILWQDSNVIGDGVYALEAGESGFESALQEALDEIVNIIVDKTLRAW